MIGGVGHTGDAAGTPNHLHFQVRQNGQWINPFNFLTPLPDIGGAPGAGFAPGATDPFAIDPGGPPSVTDADQDGLIDQFEQLFGTDTTKADTDGDGLSDAYETSVSHTDPLSIDTDHDGITDAAEIANGQDPGHGQIPDAVRAAGFGGLATAGQRQRRRQRSAGAEGGHEPAGRRHRPRRAQRRFRGGPGQQPRCRSTVITTA